MTKVITLSLLLFLTGALLALYPHDNYAIFSAINQAFPLPVFWLSITNSGSVACVGCLLFIALRQRRWQLSNALICAFVAHYLVKFAKYFFAQARPEHSADLVNLISLGPALAPDNYSMPSGHTTTAFAAAVFIARAQLLRRWQLWLLFFYAGLIAISRIAVGAHWPSDILVGAGLGLLLGWLFSDRRLLPETKSITLLSHWLYLAFFVAAIGRIASITSPATAISEGIVVAAGILASRVWISSIKRELEKNVSLL